MLAAEPWLFGDEYTLAVDDQRLTAALSEHIKILEREELADESEPVTLEEGKIPVVDMLFSAAIPMPTQRHEHLVVELKRPSVKLGPAELTQISEYADAVARDPRFDKVDVKWNFWLVGNAMTDFVAGQAEQPNTPPGVVSQPHAGRVTIWAKTWAQILDDCEQRLKFVQERLAYRSTHDTGVAYLRRAHAKYLPAALDAGD